MSSLLNVQYPTYTVILPVSKQEVKFRPFTVKEEKLLLISQEEKEIQNVVSAIGQIFNNTTFGKIDITKINKTDAEWLFVQIRNRSMGETTEVRGICKECKHKTPITLNLDNVTVINLEDANTTIDLFDDVWVTLKYPNLQDAILLSQMDGTTCLANAIDTVIEGESVKQASEYPIEERIELIESLTQKQLELFSPFLDKSPQVVLDVKFKCKCGVENETRIEGIEGFFQ